MSIFYNVGVLILSNKVKFASLVRFFRCLWPFSSCDAIIEYESGRMMIVAGSLIGSGAGSRVRQNVRLLSCIN